MSNPNPPDPRLVEIIESKWRARAKAFNLPFGSKKYQRAEDDFFAGVMSTLASLHPGAWRHGPWIQRMLAKRCIVDKNGPVHDGNDMFVSVDASGVPIEASKAAVHAEAKEIGKKLAAAMVMMLREAGKAGKKADEIADEFEAAHA